MMGQEKFLFQGLVVLVSIICISQSARIMYDVSIVPEHCLNTKAIEANYTPRGVEYEIGNLTVYESQNRAAKRLLILVYDIFGMTTNIKQVGDSIAELHDFRVVLPDFFRGNQFWSLENFTLQNPVDIQNWLQQNAGWDDVVKFDLINVMNEFKTRDNITEVGIFGMCWGGKISTLAATELPEIKVAGLVHPSSVVTAEANGVKAPMYLLPSANEPDMLPFYEILKQNFGDNCGHRRFDDMAHGFAGARANFSDPLNVQRVEEVIGILGAFFNRNLNST
ncbi:putative AIM2 family protein C30D10.14 [Orchesella cincta]|uniref:Putative AIM2 family protein C30D10.14 n=1 Tax=Orchesella cincta TaxID=48709 RepID=A0A1D2MXP4_ORCCI|nr:putative AIM2 family protein C30D10.14 [Orchesella cincta]